VAAESRRIPFVLGCQSSVSLEDVAAAAPGTTRWFQSHVFRDRAMNGALLDRVKAAGYSVLVVTVDVPVVGKRERDLRQHLKIPPVLTGSALVDAVRRPGWTWDFLHGREINFANYDDHVSRSDGQAMSLADWSSGQMELRLSWENIAWFRQRWSGPLVVKGIMSADDANRAAAEGADGVVVSNHGGRQLDGTAATASVLEEIAGTVAATLDVFVDGGIRRGADVVKALALGWRACFLGRAYLYGLGGGGRPGVERSVDIVLDELRRTMALVGARSARDIDASFLRSSPPHDLRRAVSKVNDSHQHPDRTR
jgi:L-lactate dehydrogenase (cytochrome)